jgi:hypothetical protein
LKLSRREHEQSIVIGIAVVIVAVTAAILLNQNHGLSNGSSSTSTSTSTTSTTSTTTSENITNIPYDTFYFINETNSQYYYILVLNYNDYMAWLQYAELQGAVNLMNAKIMCAGVFQPGYSYPIQVTKTVVIGNYLFVIGYSSYKMNVTVGSTYNMDIVVTNGYGGGTYIASGTYEGNWTGPIP